MVAVNDREKCLYCAGCPIVCPVGAIELRNGRVLIDGKRCTDCGACVRVCPTGAMSIKK